MRHQFVTLLGSGIKTDRIIHFVIGAIRDFGVTAINGTGRGIHKVLYPTLPIIITVTAGFKNIVKTDEVTFDVSIGIGNTVAYTRLRCKIDYHVKTVIIEKAADEGLVGKVTFDKGIGTPRILGGYLFQTVQTVFLDTDIIIVVHAVKTDNTNRTLSSKKTFHQIGAYKTGGTGN